MYVTDIICDLLKQLLSVKERSGGRGPTYAAKTGIHHEVLVFQLDNQVSRRGLATLQPEREAGHLRLRYVFVSGKACAS